MGLSIQLDTDQERPSARIYSPGDTISGKVIFSPDKADEIRSLDIKFFGRSKADFRYHNRQRNRQEHHRYEAGLFQYGVQLFKGPFKLPARVHEWRFTFTFPSHTTLDLNGVLKPKPFFNANPQPLPPSGRWGGSRSVLNEYALEARIPRTFLDTVSERVLRFTPTRDTYIVDLPPVTPWEARKLHHIDYRLEDGVPRPLTMKEGFKNFFRSHEETLRLEFHGILDCPKILIIGGIFELSLRLVSNEPISKASSSIPTILLKSVRVTLMTEVLMRVPTTWSYMSDSTTYTRTLCEWRCAENQTIPLELNGPPISLSPGIFQVAPTWEDDPSASSYLMAITHYIKIDYTLESLGSQFKSAVELPDVQVLPGRVPQELLPSPLPPPPPPEPSSSSAEPPPPPYTSDSKH